MKKHEETAKQGNMSRRSFLGVMATSGVVAATMTGCSPVADTSGTGWIPNQYQNKGNLPPQVKGRVPLDPDNVSLIRNDEKCILCGQCIEACQRVQSVFGFYELPVQDDFVCVHCGQCALWCPTGAIKERSNIEEVRKAINDPSVTVVVQTAPATRVGLAEEFGLPAGTWAEGQQVAALRALGFDKVLDTNFTADLTIMEEGSELVERIKTGHGVMPQLTSCCPGWVKFLEYYYPDLIPNLSTAKSPQQMLGAMLKTYYAEKTNTPANKIFSVSLMPCTAKKFEASRPEFNDAGIHAGDESIRDIDVVLTVRELAIMMKEAGIDYNSLNADEKYDSIMGEGSGAGLIFGNTGGVMEAAVRSAYFLITGQNPPEGLYKLEPVRGLDGVKAASLDIPGAGTVRIAVAHGLHNARTLCEEIRAGKSQYHFIEIMACPGGCISGGGQPRTSVPPSDEVRAARIATMYNKDASYSLRLSHENKEVNTAYAEFLGKPLSHLAHELLHTEYTSRANVLEPKKTV